MNNAAAKYHFPLDNLNDLNRMEILPKTKPAMDELVRQQNFSYSLSHLHGMVDGSGNIFVFLCLNRSLINDVQPRTRRSDTSTENQRFI